MTNQRMKWDAEAAFKRIAAHEEGRSWCSNGDLDKKAMAAPYTPPPNVAAWLKAQADKPKPHGRDIEALMRYHEAHKKPVGYWEDAPRGMKFGGQPLPSAVTKPHGKDVDTADGPWPKCVNWFGIAVYVFAGPAKNQGLYHRDDGTTDRAAGDYADRLRNGGVSMPNPEASQWLEQNGHADVAAQLRGKTTTPPADDEFEPVGTMPAVGDSVSYCGMVCCVSDVGGVCIRIRRGDSTYALHRDYDFMGGTARILKRKPTAQTVAARAWKEDRAWWRVQIGGRHYIKPHTENRSWPYARGWAESAPELDKSSPTIEAFCRGRGAAELHGTERDAIVAECCAAMKLDRKTGEPINK